MGFCWIFFIFFWVFFFWLIDVVLMKSVMSFVCFVENFRFVLGVFFDEICNGLYLFFWNFVSVYVWLINVLFMKFEMGFVCFVGNFRFFLHVWLSHVILMNFVMGIVGKLWFFWGVFTLCMVNWCCLIIFFDGFCLFCVDLLFKDYNSDQKFTVSTYSPTGVVSWIFYFCF